MVLLRKLRQEKGLSINQLAKATGVTGPTILNIENKQYKTSNDRLEKLANYFEIADPLELLKNVTKVIKKKKCLNQRCPLNKQKYCQSPIVTNGKDFCQSENEVSQPSKELKFNSTSALFID
ncbi:helix-turn-helix transcriptional regulator [Clostridium sp.]|uniref:helix-turn-helix domain-containing protein n=1 Tax=Clostridium sp. TaxID=1506 RepID=UPI002840A8F8|nr:helix-turn-helix transcriptional regulator [Clostridium sp.]MDR3595133.1 helix-turn-helix transcriptional regulator [Clostridium sp.]